MLVPRPDESHALRWRSADDVTAAFKVEFDSEESVEGASKVGRLEVGGVGLKNVSRIVFRCASPVPLYRTLSDVCDLSVR